MINSPIRYIVAIIPIASILIIYSATQNEHPSSKSFIYCLPLIVLIIIGILICYKIGGDNVKNFNSEILRVFGIGFWLTLISSLILTIFGVSAPIKNANTLYIYPEADDKNRPSINPADEISMPLQQHKSEIVIDNKESINFIDLYKKGVDWYIRNRKVALITLSSCTMVLILLIVLGSTIWSTQHKVEKYIDAGQYEQAKGLLFTEIQKKPNDEDWQYLLGECYLASGDVPNASESFKRAIGLNPSYKGKTIELLNKMIFKNLDNLNITASESDAQLLLSIDPNASNAFSQKALDIARGLSNSTENADKLVNLGDFSISHNNSLTGDWGNLLKVFIEKNSNTLDNTALSNICEKVAGWNPSLNGEFSNMLLSKAKGELNKGDFDENVVQSLLNSATSMNENLKEQAGSMIFAKLNSRFSDLKGLGKSKFLSLFSMCESFGVTSEISNSSAYQLAAAIKNHESGDKDLAMQIFNGILSKEPNSIEGQISKQILSPPPIGRINFNAPLFNFMGTWSYGTGELTNNGVTIQLISADVTSSNVIITFTIKSNNQKQVFIYHPVYHNQEYFQELFPPYLQDDNGKIVYSIHGFIGGRQEAFNSYANKISFNPNEQVTVKVDFPMISSGATTVKFVCPGEGGHQEEWSWDNLKLKNDIFD